MAKSQAVAYGPVARWLDREAGASGDRPPAWAVDLVASVDPIAVPIALKQRMLLSLGNGRPHPRPRWLRTAVVCAVLLSGTAVASAGFAGWPGGLARVCRALVAGPPPAFEPAPPAEPHRARSAAPAARLTANVNAAETAAALDETLALAPPAVRRNPDSRHRVRLRLSDPADPALVVGATRALRVDGDARRARSLAAQYLRQYPRGDLAEEALAIEVEAAMDSHDPDAGEAAARYLSLYPQGAFRAVAQRALAAR